MKVLNVLNGDSSFYLNSGVENRQDLYDQFWKNTAIYGMGDVQIDLYIKSMIRNNKIRSIHPDLNY